MNILPIYNFEFTEQEVREAVANDRLLSMEIEFSRICNFRCAYCYVPEKSACLNELSPDEIKNVILQAKDLGARKIIILGGEPSIYPQLIDMIRFLSREGLQIELFTNGSGVDKNLANILAEEKVRVVLKLNSRDEETQDRLAGRKGAFKTITQAYEALKEARYPASDRFFAISTVICRQNIKELPAMWQWLREEKIEPYFEIITPQADAVKNDWLMVDTQEVEKLFAELSSIDKRLYGRSWDPQPPLVGHKCLRHQVSCVVTATGDVMPCVGVTIALGNVRNRRLADILKHSEVVSNLKNYREMIKGECRTCDKSEECYGCRGAAYQLTGDYLASDPTCWRVTPSSIT